MGLVYTELWRGSFNERAIYSVLWGVWFKLEEVFCEGLIYTKWWIGKCAKGVIYSELWGGGSNYGLTDR